MSHVLTTSSRIQSEPFITPLVDVAVSSHSGSEYMGLVPRPHNREGPLVTNDTTVARVSIDPFTVCKTPAPCCTNDHLSRHEKIHACALMHLAHHRAMRPPDKSYTKKKIEEKSGNEVYCTNVLLLLMKIMLCSNLHRQKIF